MHIISYGRLREFNSKQGVEVEDLEEALGSQDIAAKLLIGELEIDRAKLPGNFFNVDSSLFVK